MALCSIAKSMLISNNQSLNLSKELHALSSDSGIKKDVYVTANEYFASRTARILARAPVDPGFRVHMGFSGLQNYDMASIRKSNFVIVADVNNATIDLHKVAIETLKKTKNRHTFINDFLKNFKAKNLTHVDNIKYCRKGQSLKVKDELLLEARREGSFLFADDLFEHIQTLAQKDRIFPMNLGLIDKERMEKIGAIFAKNKAYLDTLYISNIGDWFLNDELLALGEIVKKISSDHVLVIDASERVSSASVLQQYVIPITGGDYNPFIIRGYLSRSEPLPSHFSRPAHYKHYPLGIPASYDWSSPEAF